MVPGIPEPLSSMAQVGCKRQILVFWDPTLYGSDSMQPDPSVPEDIKSFYQFHSYKIPEILTSLSILAASIN